MKKNLYFRTLLRRENLLKKNMITYYLELASIVRMPIELFTRKDFGERYFNLASFFTVVLALFAMPILLIYTTQEISFKIFFLHYFSFYIFLGLFIAAGLKRYRETERNPSVFDFARLSTCAGTIHPFFFKKRRGKEVDRRTVEILYEPGLFFIIGAALTLLRQPLGFTLMVTSVYYCLSYWAAYQEGDNYVLDLIDQMILNEEMEKCFVEDAPPEETRGFHFVGRKPSDHEVRRRLLPQMIEDEEFVTAR